MMHIFCKYFIFYKKICLFDFIHRGNDTQALINYCQAMNLFREIGNEHGVGICCNNIGNIHLKNKRFIEAIDCYKQALEIGENEINEYINKNKDNFSPRILLSDENFRKSMKTRADRACQLAKAKLQKIQNKISPLSCFSINQEALDKDLDQIIELLSSANENYQEITLMQSKIILNKINISLAFLLKFDLENAVLSIEEAENMVKDLKKKELSLSIIPKEVLLQKLLVQKGLIEKQKGNHMKAAEYFTESIETAQEYDPVTKKQ